MTWDSALAAPLVEQLWQDPAGLLASGTVLQAKSRATVVRLHTPGGAYILKYHNWGGWYPTARKAWRTSPARRQWLDGRYLAAHGVRTPLPRAMVEMRHGPLCTASYLLVDFVAGPSLYDVVRSPHLPAERAACMAEQMAALWRQLDQLAVTHNDMKPENFLIDDHDRLWLIDLEKLRRHRRRESLAALQRTDAARLLHLRAWRYQPAVCEAFRQTLLQHTPAGHRAQRRADPRHPLQHSHSPEKLMANQLTVLIPCKDEVKNIRPCIESVRAIADEILVADSGSTDGTLDVVRGLGGCRIIERAYVNSADFKNWAIPQASHPWVLVVDADERVTPDLAKEIQCVLAAGPAEDGYRIERRTYFFGHLVKYGNCWGDAPLRLFRREYRYQVRNVHADVIVPTGKVGKLKSKFLHYTCWTMAAYLKTLDRYTTWAAEDMHRRGRRATLHGTWLHAPWRFIHTYFLRLGFLDGWAGLHVAILSSFYISVKLAKLWELDYALRQPDPEAATGAPLRLFDPEQPRPASPAPLKSAM